MNSIDNECQHEVREAVGSPEKGQIPTRMIRESFTGAVAPNADFDSE
jgi:hypothetical protein